MDWSRVYGAQGRACQFGSPRSCSPFDVRLPGGRRSLVAAPSDRRAFAILLTLTRADGRYTVVGDTYEYGSITKNILEPIK